MKSRLLLVVLLFSLVYSATSLNLSRGQSGRISQLVGQILSSNHLRQEALNNRLSKIALDTYLDALDVNHQVFLQSDVDEFRKEYAANLDDLTIKDRDAQPAFTIYDRYLDRLTERVDKVSALLELEHDFEADESLELNRSEKPWPKTNEEANELWRLRIKSDMLAGRLQNETPEEVKERLSKRYTRLLKAMDDLEHDEVLQIYLTAIGNAYDPHSTYMSPSEWENFEIHSVKLELSGIGAMLRSEDGYCKIVSLVPGGPASMSKQIKPNDRIIAVAQGEKEAVDVVEMKLNKVVDMIRGERGTEVRLTIIPASSVDGSERKIVPIVRDVIQLTEQKAKAKIIELPNGEGTRRKLGVIDLPQYYDDSAKDVRQIINRLKLEEVEGIVLDLRRNGGGILDEAVRLTGLFFRRGPVVQVRDFQNRVDVMPDRDPRIAYDGPLVVLVSRLSASASEITAAALQDYGRAIIVGDEATHGKGTVQTLQDLSPFMNRSRFARRTKNESGMLKYTISNFYRIAGNSTQKYGVKPDIVLPSIYDHMEVGEEHLPNSLEPDQIPAAKYKTVGQTKPYIEPLKQDSAQRIKETTDFKYVLEDIDRYLKLKARDSVSLKESQRLAEKENDKARSEARKAEREARPARDESVHLLTLEATVKAKELVKLPYLAADKPEPDPNAETEETEESTSEDGEAEDEESGPRYDPHLREALHILSDYVDALKQAPNSDESQDLS